MNEMAQRAEALCALREDGCSAEPLSELEAFVSMDSTLAALNKEYLEARDYRRELAKLHGHDDPMVEVAADMEDSSWCAMQTRYIELREKRELMEQAQRLMRQSEDKIEIAIEEKKKRQVTRFMEWARSLQLLKKNNKPDPILEWALIVVLFSPRNLLRPPSLRSQFAV